MLKTVLEISLSMSVVIALLLCLIPVLNKRYAVGWRYYVWLILALRLAIPVNITLPKAPVTIHTSPVQVVVSKSEAPRFERTDAAISETESETLSERTDLSANPVRKIPLAQILFWVWLVGAILFIGITLFHYGIFQLQVRPYLKRMEGDFSGLAGKMKLKRVPPVYACEKILSPMMIGFLRPKILLPETDYAAEELQVILLHELTHYKRKDIWYKVLLMLANAVHWFNPLVYLMVRQANRDVEFSCDARVCKGKDLAFRKTYSLYILNAMRRGKQLALSAHLSEPAKQVKKRMGNILDSQKKKAGVMLLIAAVVLTAGVCMFFAMQPETEEVLPVLPKSEQEMQTLLQGKNAESADVMEIVHGKAEDTHLLEEFLEKVQKREPAQMIAGDYTIEGDLILTLLIFDGNRYYGMIDNSRDKWGAEENKYIPFSGNYLLESAGENMVQYLVTEEKHTYQEIMLSYASSQWNAVIPNQYLFGIFEEGVENYENIY